MDNLSSHKSKEVKATIRKAGARLIFLPPYSPDLNPIEMAFSKLKTLLRKAAERTQETLWHRIGLLLDEFKPEECQNYIRHAGYASADNKTLSKVKIGKAFMILEETVP